MSLLLGIAAFLAVAVGAAHSALGERYILTRLFRRADLPSLFGGTAFTKHTLRFAWHLTTIAWWGLAAIIWLLAQDLVSYRRLASVLAATFLVTGLITLTVSRGRHLAWPVFLCIGGICAYASIV